MKMRECGRYLACGSLALILAGCNARGNGPAVETTTAAITLSERVVGFESVTDWTATSATLAPGSVHSEGSQSLAVRPSGVAEVTSAAFPIGAPAASVAIDVLLPTEHASASWAGSLSLALDCPSRSVNRATVGQVQLAGSAHGSFITLPFALPSDLQSKLGQGCSSLRAIVTLNVPAVTGSYLLDRLNLGTGAVATGTNGQVNAISLDYSVPFGPALQDVALAANDSVDIGNYATVTREDATQYPTVGNLGSGQFLVGVEAHLGTIFSAGGVFLAERATVHGDVTTGNTVTTQSEWTIQGTKRENQQVSRRSLSRAVNFPSTLSPELIYAPDQKTDVPITPGGYAGLTVFSRASVPLVAGTYYFDKLDVEPESELVIDDSSGPVYVYVRRELILHGPVKGKAVDTPKVLLGYFGSNEVGVTAPFRGTLIAPSARINLEDIGSTNSHKGAFFGNIVRVAPGVHVELHSFSWVIDRVNVSSQTVCPGDSVDIDIVASDPSGAGGPVEATVNGMPGRQRVIQLLGAPGMRAIAATATAGGVTETMITYTNVVACASQPPRPVITMAPDRYQRDTVIFVVRNRNEMPSGATYVWHFGDGSSETTSFPTASHSYAAAFPGNQELVNFELTVDVLSGGSTWSSARKTVTVHDQYAMNARLGLLAPPTMADFDVPLRDAQTGVRTAAFEVTNRDSSVLTLSSYRIDLLPCDEEAQPTVGDWQNLSTSVPGRGTGVVSVSFADPPTSACTVAVRVSGHVADGRPAMTATYFDLARPRATRRTSPAASAVLHALASARIIDPKEGISIEEYDRFVRQGVVESAMRSQGSAAAPAQADACDPVAGEPLAGTDCDPESPPSGNLTCQASLRDWNIPVDGEVVNGLKGDLVTSRRCGFAAEMFKALRPQQIYTHFGIMDSNRTRVRHSTAFEGWAPAHMEVFPGVGFSGSALKYQWPGAVTFSAYEAFETGQDLHMYGKDKDVNVPGFNKSWHTCFDDSVVAYPLLIKPPPADELTTRGRLHDVANAARNLQAHYRMYGFTDASISSSPSYSGPSGEGWGGAATVCTSFVRQAALDAGLQLDAVRNEPENHTQTPWGHTGDGLYYYGPEQRLAAGSALWSFIHNEVREQLQNGNWGIDELLSLASAGTLDIDNALLPTLAVQLANQTVNCFALDRCSAIENVLPLWTTPTPGVAVADDDIVRFWDSPAQGGGYGYREQLLFRPHVVRARTCWAPSAGTGSLRVHTVDSNGQPIVGATVSLRPASDDVLPRASEPWPNQTPELSDDAAALFGAVRAGTYTAEARYQVPAQTGMPATDLSGKTPQPFTVVANEDNVVTVVLLPPEVNERRVTMNGVASVEYHGNWNSKDYLKGLELTTTTPFQDTGMAEAVCNNGRRRLLIGLSGYSLGLYTNEQLQALVAQGNLAASMLEGSWVPGTVAVKVSVQLNRNYDCITACRCRGADNRVARDSAWIRIAPGETVTVTSDGTTWTFGTFWGNDGAEFDGTIYNEQMPRG